MNQQLFTPSEEIGRLQIMHLKRYWNKAMLIRNAKEIHEKIPDEYRLDSTLLFSLGLGIEQTMMHLYQNAPSFDQFEQWIIDTAGQPSPETIDRFNKIFTDAADTGSIAIPKVLDQEQLAFWDENGYIILRNAVPKEDCEKTIETICRFIEIDRNDPSTWYKPHPSRQGIMVQLFQDHMLEKNRNTNAIRSAYEQLWSRTDLWVSADRVGFNPPETKEWKFPGPRLHWDVEVKLPIPFSLQGLLYLSDTAANQGAFSLVPGFHNRIDGWINNLPKGTNPATEDLKALGCIPIAANAGDFIIWHQALPHGSSPNTAKKPRFVQYITYGPANV
ncbi:hypothetical protein BH09BAC6_BH09BAC6_29630 [soil metagenome]|jgi:hypothetical protein